MAGFKIAAKSNLPDPKFSTVSTQAAAAPGTVAAWILKLGSDEPLISAFSRRYSIVNAAGVL